MSQYIQDQKKIRLLLELRRAGVTDTRVLSAIERVPREQFVPDTFRDQAWENRPLPIGKGQTISQPEVVALMTQALQVSDRHKVLEIGTGSGYQAAVLSYLCRRLYTIERHKVLLEEAEARFRALKLTNIVTRWGDGTLGWPEQAPFDRILVTAAARSRPENLLAQLSDEGGIMITPMGADAWEQAVWRFTRTKDGLQEEMLWPVRFVPLIPEPGQQ